jgi:hypothetical protein
LENDYDKPVVLSQDWFTSKLFSMLEKKITDLAGPDAKNTYVEFMRTESGYLDREFTSKNKNKE